LPGLDERTPQPVWAALATRCPRWSAALLQDLAAALRLQPHLGKTLSMLSTGTRCKVALAGLLAAGATLTCLDQPYAALDMAAWAQHQQRADLLAGEPALAHVRSFRWKRTLQTLRWYAPRGAGQSATPVAAYYAKLAAAQQPVRGFGGALVACTGSIDQEEIGV
jgi:hypothetical protein